MDSTETKQDEMIGGHEVNDGRNDIMIGFEGVEHRQLLVGQELYLSAGFTYEDMKTKIGLGKFLSTYGLFLMHQGGLEVFNLPQLLENYKKLHDVAQYFVDRCEGTHPTDGPIRSTKTYGKFKAVLDKIKEDAGPAKPGTELS